jgi:Superfamily II DNA/RNA helicases, SNF2 family
MPKYPETTNDDFYSKINDIYNNFKVRKDNRSLENICNPREFKLQLPQKFLAEFINLKTPYKGILVYHRIGAGKTCTAIRIAEKWKKYKRIIVVVPASLKNNFRGELRSLCADDHYLKDTERKELKELDSTDKRYGEIIEKSDERIDQYYEIYSYNKFVELVKNKTLNLKNAILIIDEIQNMVSEEGTFYHELYNIIHKSSEDLRVILMSATPMFDKPNEIALTMNLLRLSREIPIGKQFDKTFIKATKRKDGTYTHNVTNMDEFKKYIKGYVSFFRGAPPIVFPKMIVRYVECEMSSFQYGAYIRLLRKEESELGNSAVYLKKVLKSLNVSDLPNNFYIGTRMISNIVFPNKKINNDGFNSLTNKKIQDNLQTYSCKFYEIINKIENSSGKIFVYSGFKEFGGIKSFIRILEAFGYKDYKKNGTGANRFAIWSGDESISVKEEIKTIYNMPENIAGKKLKILLGSPSIKEGVSLTAVRQVHILEPYWNKARLDQVIGRASRFCSHKDVPENKRFVRVYIYVATSPKIRNKQISETVDQYIQKLATEKDKIIKQFEKAIKEASIDCHLNRNANVYDDEDGINCDI